MENAGNKGEKIVVLSVVAVVAVALVLIFSPTIVKPPMEVPINDLHSRKLEGDIALFSKEKGDAFNDSLYVAVEDKLAMYRKESILSTGMQDHYTTDLANCYVPVFVELSNRKFEASKWYESDHIKIRNRIASLRRLALNSNNSGPLTDAHKSELRKLEKVIEDYKRAKAVSGYSVFYDVSDANVKISQAEKCMETPPLRNCKELVDKLSQVKVKIGQSHFSKVESTVRSMANYRSMSEQDFKVLAGKADNEITEYKSNCSKYGAGARSAEGLSTDAYKYNNEAKEFYIPEQVVVSAGYEWKKVSSAYSNYMSYHADKSKSNASMSFKIKGYESYKFYVRIDGGDANDCLLVGIGSVPTENSNYFKTKGTGQREEYYKEVVINNIRKSVEYTVHVVFKNSRENSYGSSSKIKREVEVLIPYAKSNTKL